MKEFTVGGWNLPRVLAAYSAHAINKKSVPSPPIPRSPSLAAYTHTAVLVHLTGDFRSHRLNNTRKTYFAQQKSNIHVLQQQKISSTPR